MSRMARRRVLRLFASAPLAAGFAWSQAEALAAHRLAHHTTSAAQGFTPQFFTPREYETVRMLVDILIPADERSGSATEAGVPEFMDFIMMDPTPVSEEGVARRTAMRGGLAWLDVECLERFDRRFVDCASRNGAGCSTRSPGRQTRPTSSRTASPSSRASEISPPPASGPARWGWRICSTGATRSCPNGSVVQKRR